MILLNENVLSQHCPDSNFKFHIFSSIDSTNQFLKELPYSPFIDVCCAETQTQGRGRFARHWHSPFGENIYCSSRWPLDYSLTQVSGLSLVISLAIMSTLEHFNLHHDILIKWPNDLIWHEKKLCGILIETTSMNNALIIGIGLNVNSIIHNHPSLDKPWCSLYEISGRFFDRNLLIAQLILQLKTYMILFKQYGFPYFLTQWRKFDYLLEKRIRIFNHNKTLIGIVKGVNDEGLLILRDDHNVMHYLSSGEASLSGF